MTPPGAPSMRVRLEAAPEPDWAFLDLASGLTLVAHVPGRAVGLWRAYLDGAEAQYRQRGVESALMRPLIEDGSRVSLFVLAVDEEGRIHGGIRCHGPLSSPDDAAALWEMRACARPQVVRRAIQDRLSGGLVEVKGAWLQPGAPSPADASSALARCHLHFMDHFGARSALCTCADNVAPKWQSAGGSPLVAAGAAPYPDDRYRTIMLVWDRETAEGLVSQLQSTRLAQDRLQLAA